MEQIVDVPVPAGLAVSEDLPLNNSRETLRHEVCCLDMLAEICREGCWLHVFYAQFGQCFYLGSGLLHGAKIAELLRFNAWDDCLVTPMAMGGTCAVPHFCGLRTFRRGGPRWLTPKVWAVEAGWRSEVRPQGGVF